MPSRLPNTLLAIALLLTVAALGWFIFGPSDGAVDTATSWRELRQEIPSSRLYRPPEQGRSDDWVASEVLPNGDQIGHCVLHNGDVWTWAFRSHHEIQGTRSLTLFRGPQGTFRLSGEYFCCEVLFPFAQPDDGDQFLNELRKIDTLSPDTL